MKERKTTNNKQEHIIATAYGNGIYSGLLAFAACGSAAHCEESDGDLNQECL